VYVFFKIALDGETSFSVDKILFFLYFSFSVRALNPDPCLIELHLSSHPLKNNNRKDFSIF